MAKRTDTEFYRESFNKAVELANLLKREVGIEVLRSGMPGENPYVVRSLPKPENRRGFELRCQIVRPGEPLIAGEHK